MVGKIISIANLEIQIELNINEEQKKNLINFHVVFELDDRRVLGEVSSVNENNASISLIGEIINNDFIPGVSKKPFFGAECRIIKEEELALIIGANIPGIKFNVGLLPQYSNYKVNIPVDSFFNNHFSILGNTGSGKSHGLARLVQNLYLDPNNIPLNSNLLIFDAYGEYGTAFGFLNRFPNAAFKTYTTKVSGFEDVRSEVLKIPPWLLGVDDYALLLESESVTQLPMIEKALKLVSIFAKAEEEVIVYKNDIIARALEEILYSGGTPMQIRDQIFAVLTSFNTRDLSLESKVIVPGWTRTLRQCLIIDKDGKIQEINLVSEYFKSFKKEGLELRMPDGTYTYTLKDLKDAFDFALISEGMLQSEHVYEDANKLKVRMNSLVTSVKGEYFNVKEYISKQDYVKNMVYTKDGRKAQIINFNINYIDDRFAKVLVKIISKQVFEYCAALDDRASNPYHLILEEAHRYVQNDNDINIIGYNIFERITKEGRKYGVILGMISQRPSEISETAISQCTNFLVFRMQHPKDLRYIKEMIPNISEEIIDKFKVLQPGNCMAFGSAFKIPLLLKLPLPNPLPYSQNTDIQGCWYIKKGEEILSIDK